MISTSNTPSFIIRLYVWSILFELLLTITIPILGLQPSASRFLQLITLMLLPLLLLNSRKKLHLKYYKEYAYWYLFAILGLVIGLTQGLFSSNFQGSFGGYSDSGTLRTSMPPIAAAGLEYVITLYYFIYFTLLPQYFLKTKSSINYFFSRFKYIFYIILIIGFVDFFFLAPYGIYWLNDVGNRFHSLTGEPRHTFVYLILVIAIIHLDDYFNGNKPNLIQLIFIITALSLTKSFSGMVGIALFICFVAVYFFFNGSALSKIKILMASLIVIIFSYYFLANDERLTIYTDTLQQVWPSLEDNGTLPYPFSVQGRTIYPLHDLTVKFREGNIFPVLFGSGLGSSSIISNLYDFKGLVENPSSQFVKIVFETGVVGLTLFFLAFWIPSKKLIKKIQKKGQIKFILVTLLILAAGLSQKNAGMFIYFGIFYTVMMHMSKSIQVQPPNK